MGKVTFRDARIEDLSIIVEIYNSTIPSRMVTADTEFITSKLAVRPHFKKLS